jgi:hypothetical protein
MAVPTFLEQKRAAWFQEQFESLGRSVSIDRDDKRARHGPV